MGGGASSVGYSAGPRLTNVPLYWLPTRLRDRGTSVIGHPLLYNWAWVVAACHHRVIEGRNKKSFDSHSCLTLFTLEPFVHQVMLLSSINKEYEYVNR